MAVGKKELLRGAFTQASIEVLEEKIAAFESEKSALLKAIDHILQPEKKVTDDKSAGVEEAARIEAEQLYSCYPLPNDNWSYKAIRLAYEQGATFGANWKEQQSATGAMVEENERLRKALQKIVNGRTTKNMSKILSDTQMARIAKQALTPKP